MDNNKVYCKRNVGKNVKKSNNNHAPSKGCFYRKFKGIIEQQNSNMSTEQNASFIETFNDVLIFGSKWLKSQQVDDGHCRKNH